MQDFQFTNLVYSCNWKWKRCGKTKSRCIYLFLFASGPRYGHFTNEILSTNKKKKKKRNMKFLIFLWECSFCTEDSASLNWIPLWQARRPEPWTWLKLVLQMLWSCLPQPGRLEDRWNYGYSTNWQARNVREHLERQRRKKEELGYGT
jgi:hypothetical protein